MHGPAAHVALTLNPSSIVADYSQYSVARAVVTDAHGNAVPDATVTMTSSDGHQSAP